MPIIVLANIYTLLDIINGIIAITYNVFSHSNDIISYNKVKLLAKLTS